MNYGNNYRFNYHSGYSYHQRNYHFLGNSARYRIKSAVKNEDKEAGAQQVMVVPKIEYKEDLSGREIVIRGFGNNQESISKYIYDITHLPYLSNAEITAIEEHKIENGIYNIFEIKVTGGVYK